MTPSVRALAFVLVAAVVTTPALGQTSRPYVVVRSGLPIEIAADVAINPDCSSLGQTSVNLLVAPRGGNVMVGPGRHYNAFAPGNPRAACNHRKLPATIITYRSYPGFTGEDSFVVEEIFPTGTAIKQRFSVNVR